MSEEEEGEYYITKKGLQTCIDGAGKRFEMADAEGLEAEAALAMLDMIIFAQYAEMRGWIVLNRMVLGPDDE